MSENFNAWVERLARDPQNSKPLSAGEVVKSSAGEPFGAVQFVRIDQTDFVAEVGKKGNQYVYHLYPHSDVPQHLFQAAMSLSFEELFKEHGEVEMGWVPEMLSWSVRVLGWTNHVWGDELAIRVVERIQEKLNAASTPPK